MSMQFIKIFGTHSLDFLRPANFDLTLVQVNIDWTIGFWLPVHVYRRIAVVFLYSVFGFFYDQVGISSPYIDVYLSFCLKKIG
jgi:hypothetical protein